jgi:hypothetical protein
MARATMHSHTRPSAPDQEDAFNAWYDEVHLPQVMDRIPGVISAQRFRLSRTQLVADDEVPRRPYVTVYELDTDDLPRLVARLDEALRDGTLDPSDAVDSTDLGPVVHLYEPVPDASLTD